MAGLQLGPGAIGAESRLIDPGGTRRPGDTEGMGSRHCGTAQQVVLLQVGDGELVLGTGGGSTSSSRVDREAVS